MNKLITLFLMTTLLFSTPNEWVMDTAWNNATDEQRFNMSCEYKARACGLTEEEFIFFARVVEAESDRSRSMDGKIHIAAVILNRVRSDSFPDTVTGVLTQSGQFEVVSNGWCSISNTPESEWAIIEAYRALDAGEIPSNLLYFNCIGFSSWNYDYAYIDGNYFSCG